MINLYGIKFVNFLFFVYDH